MKDRVSAKPGRMLITPEGSGEPFYATVALADEPTVEGTPLNKASLLQDTTAGALGLDSTATVNDAFVGVLKKLGLTPVFLTVTVGGATAKAGIPINGVTNADGSQLVTDGVTQTYLCFSESTSVTVSSGGYQDMPSKSISGQSPNTGILNLSIELNPQNGTRKYTSSSTAKFSPYISKLDVCCIGGGGGGGGAFTNLNSHYTTGGGGGGGRLVNSYDVPVSGNITYQITVGSGGAGGDGNKSGTGTGKAGGKSLFKIQSENDILVEANGGNGGGQGRYVEFEIDDEDHGSGGSGNGSGGKNAKGYNAIDGYVFGSSSIGQAGGGGGSGNTSLQYAGGTPYGGTGAALLDERTAKSGTGDGGGGGGGMRGQDNNYEVYDHNGASGYRGAVYLRWEVSLT